jgi:hypothetical protein
MQGLGTQLCNIRYVIHTELLVLSCVRNGAVNMIKPCSYLGHSWTYSCASCSK